MEFTSEEIKIIQVERKMIYNEIWEDLRTKRLKDLFDETREEHKIAVRRMVVNEAIDDLLWYSDFDDKWDDKDFEEIERQVSFFYDYMLFASPPRRAMNEDIHEFMCNPPFCYVFHSIISLLNPHHNSNSTRNSLTSNMEMTTKTSR